MSKLLELAKKHTDKDGGFLLIDDKGRPKNNENKALFSVHARQEAILCGDKETANFLAQQFRAFSASAKIGLGKYARQSSDTRPNSHDNLFAHAIGSPAQARAIWHHGITKPFFWHTGRRGRLWENIKGAYMSPASVFICKHAAGLELNCYEAKAVAWTLTNGSHNLRRSRLIYFINTDKKVPQEIKDEIPRGKLMCDWGKYKGYYKGHPFFEEAFRINKGAWRYSK